MQLPVELREAMERLLEGVSRRELSERAARISELYRAGGASANAILDDLDALAYAIARLPATYGAVRNALGRLQERCPEFAPRSVLDLGAGPGTASWAAVYAWPQVAAITLIDSNARLLELGRSLSDSAANDALRHADRTLADLARDLKTERPADLVIVSYTLAEIAPSVQRRVLAEAWERCAGALAIVEPGTPAGYARILAARGQLIANGGKVLAPCPHELACPLAAPDWCHFVQRVARSRDHMLLKSAEAPYEDEKFSYLVVVREGLFQAAEKDRILARSEISRAGINLKVCRTDGSAGLVTIGKREKIEFKRAKKLAWGDLL